MNNLNQVDHSIISELSKYDSATVQNASILVRGYINHTEDYTGPDLTQYIESKKTIVGYALTSKWTPLNEKKGVDDKKLDFFDNIFKMKIPVVSVLSDVDSTPNRGAIMGDGMAYQMKSLGSVGVIVGGNARDIKGIKEVNLPLWATGHVPGHGPFKMIEHGTTVQVADLTINQGDILVCDFDGVTRVEINILNDVIKMCKEVRKKEKTLHKYFSIKVSTKEWENWKKNNN
ncbi:MAG: RraA family protein [SAR202 cluster bacterium]|nr:RraA family protein [SAR202 cluster bacterium]|tara:strand:- start:8490 stop:9182 length:693 start_codon:yes stop_codon:yes gene_type:complete